jgi:uncharacterized membrane protein
MMDWNNHGEHMSTGGWIFMALGMLVLIALVVVLVMWMVSHQRPTERTTIPPGISARDALDHRLVSGQITSDEYDALRTRLETPISGSTQAEPPAPPTPT